jgi:hypothetical protein
MDSMKKSQAYQVLYGVVGIVLFRLISNVPALSPAEIGGEIVTLTLVGVFYFANQKLKPLLWHSAFFALAITLGIFLWSLPKRPASLSIGFLSFALPSALSVRSGWLVMKEARKLMS